MIVGPRRVPGTLLLVAICLLLLPGCTMVPAPVALLLSSPTPTGTATATATATTTATPTFTPTPLATTTLPPPPPALIATLAPEKPAQGQTVVLRVALDRAATVSGDYDGQPLTFLYDSPVDAWALIAVAPWSAAGMRPLVLEAVAPGGQRARYSRKIEVLATAFEVQNIDVPADQLDLLAVGLRPVEDRYLAGPLQLVSGGPMWEGPFRVPTQGYRSSPFGARRSYQGGPPTGYHGGLDFAAPGGTPILAPAKGVVAMIEPLKVRGLSMLIDHGAGVHTLYFHLSETIATVGQIVEVGDLIARVGSTGLSTGPHLHWEVRIGEIVVDPDEWLTYDFRNRP